MTIGRKSGKSVVKVGKSWKVPTWRGVKETMVGVARRVAGYTEGVPREKKDWKMEVWEISKVIAREISREQAPNNSRDYMSEQEHLARIYARLRPQIVAYQKVDDEVLKEIAPLFRYFVGNRPKTIFDLETELWWTPYN
jgi:hypothetical protein